MIRARIIVARTEQHARQVFVRGWGASSGAHCIPIGTASLVGVRRAAGLSPRAEDVTWVDGPNGWKAGRYADRIADSLQAGIAETELVPA